MRRLIFIMLILFSSINTMSQTVAEDIMQLSYTRSSTSGSAGYGGIGMSVHDFDQELYNTRIGFETFLLSDLTATLMDGNYDRLKWSMPLITHGMMGDFDLRMNVFKIENIMLSAGGAFGSYHISGSASDNANYFAGGLSVGADMVLNDDFGVFTNFQMNFPVKGQAPNGGDKTDGPVFSQFQAIVKYSYFSFDYDLLTANGTTRSNIRIGVWSDLDWD